MKQIPLRNPWPGAPVYFKQSTESTMEDARRLLEQGCPAGTVAAAAFQSRGRGRLANRRWLAARGQSLLFTLVLRQAAVSSPRGRGRGPESASRTGAGTKSPQVESGLVAPAAVQRLPVLAGLAVALTLEELYALRLQVKWPNDLLFEGRKLAGVLCEAFAEGESLGLLVGIGLNCNQLEFPKELKQPATSLRAVLGRSVEPLALLEPLLRAIKALLSDRDWRAKLHERLYGLQREIAVRFVTPGMSEAARERRGVLHGVDEQGALLFQPLGSPETISLYSGEISIPGPANSSSPS
jgi:BirA family biotin operon repressor/biotin-[acetyl-CoA-carboxylase] ligase